MDTEACFTIIDDIMQQATKNIISNHMVRIIYP